MCRSFVSSTSHSVLSDAQPGDIVFLASLRMPRLGDQYTEAAASIHEVLASQAAPEAVDERSKAYDETAALVAQFAAKQLTIIFDAPKPVFRAAAFRCADWFDRQNPMCQSGLAISRSDLLALRKPIMDSLTRLSAAYSAVAVWDPFPVYVARQFVALLPRAGRYFLMATISATSAIACSIQISHRSCVTYRNTRQPYADYRSAPAECRHPISENVGLTATPIDARPIAAFTSRHAIHLLSRSSGSGL